MLNIPQKPIVNRLSICGVLLLLITGIIWWSSRSEESFNFLWNYFAWGNQVLAASTLLAAAVWLARQGENRLIAIIPGAFMLFIVCTFILWTSPAHSGPMGFGLELNLARAIGIALTVLTTVCVWRHGTKLRQKELLTPDA
jgi:carbon starvation protein CstA